MHFIAFIAAAAVFAAVNGLIDYFCIAEKPTQPLVAAWATGERLSRL